MGESSTDDDHVSSDLRTTSYLAATKHHDHDLIAHHDDEDEVEDDKLVEVTFPVAAKKADTPADGTTRIDMAREAHRTGDVELSRVAHQRAVEKHSSLVPGNIIVSSLTPLSGDRAVSTSRLPCLAVSTGL